MNNVQDVETLSDKLISYLRAKLGNPAMEFGSPLTGLRGGYETSTYRFKLDCAPDDLSRPLVLRLYPQFYGTRNAIWEAELHNIDPDPLIKTLDDKGIAEYDYRLTSRFDWLRDKADKLVWIRQGVNWLLENRPPEPERLAVCHGDFHALNILYADGEVTGVLDWPGFAIADPVFDVANSIVKQSTI